MSVLERAALKESPLADLHAIASELSIDGYRRLRKEQLIDAILERQGDSDEEPTDEESAEERSEESPEAKPRRQRGRRGGRSRTPRAEDEAEQDEEQPEEEQPERAREGRPERSREEEDEVIEGVVELLPNGSAFLRVNPPEASDEDVYVSAAQVKRCELISGDRIAGPRRPPRRSERFASLYRIDTVNGRPAAEVADGARFDDLPAAFPQEQFDLGSADATLEAVGRLTPFGKGSRVTIVGPARSGKTEILRRLAGALSEQEGIQLFVALAGVRPEEIGEWSSPAPAQAVSLAASADVQAQAVTGVVDQARRIAARGGDAVVLVDTLEGLGASAVRRTLAAARNISDGGSLTVVATANEAFGGETTVIALDPALAALGRYPALDPFSSGVWRPELLVGEEGATALLRAREEAASS